MAKGWTVSAALIIAALNGPAATAAPFSELIDFGDSLSDVGNVYWATGGYEPRPPYAGGRFSNGPLWVEDLATLLGIPKPKPAIANLFGNTDFAIAGAQTGNTSVHAANFGDLPTQLSLFRVGHPFFAPSRALYTLWFGADDLLFSDIGAGIQPTPIGTPPPYVVSQAVNNELGLVTSLASQGARNFLVVGVPDLGTTPLVRSEGSAIMAQATGLAEDYNQALVSGLAGLSASGLSIRYLDSFDLLDSAVNDPGAYGFTDVTDPCWNGNYTGQGTECASPDSYLFWDTLHPTARGHFLLAEAACAVEGYCTPPAIAAAADPVPEPGTAALLLLPLAGLAAVSRRLSQG